ncbi:hypothetical protein ARMSODRAFT_964323 [Armillaria solidipes]|uniref:Uncharacterized protein n=1 Tax=Armillaria solidipes TaxID=1076256 RepID=A0A2H3ATS6_9AGAR|nr:hypothetical protein ARMSODRAFT_964323 [Armillaria solidipes]
MSSGPSTGPRYSQSNNPTRIGANDETVPDSSLGRRTILQYNPTMSSPSSAIAWSSFGLLLLLVILIGRIRHRQRKKLTVEKVDDVESGRRVPVIGKS